jgi:hypothetical protein
MPTPMPMPMPTAAPAVPAAPAAASAPAKPAAPSGAAVRVHDHVAFVFRVPDGRRTPAERAAEASRNLNELIDQEVPGSLTVQQVGEVATVQVGGRQLFRLTHADAIAAGAPGLDDYAPQVQTSLDSFLTKERRRAQLQRGVLSISLVVFFALMVYLLFRLVQRVSKNVEERLLNGEALVIARLAEWGFGTERSRGLLLLLITSLRLAAWAGLIYLFLLSSLSLFERTRPWRDQLVSWATAPFTAFGERLLHAVPNLLLLLVLWAVLRGGWRAMTVTFDRIITGKTQVSGIPAPLVVPYRLLARAGLVLGAMLLLPLVSGSDNDLVSRVGFLLLGSLALAGVPLAATAVLGTHALVVERYRLGEWIELRPRNGPPLVGEITSVDFFHLRLVPESGGEVRVPHLSLLMMPVAHLARTRSLTVEVPVRMSAMPPARAIEVLRTAAEKVLRSSGITSPPAVELLEVTVEQARFRVAVPEGPQSLRSDLLLALVEVTRDAAVQR